ncbi:MAG: hypothetical protein WEG36_07505 [Gemmatimonadota bacterium]
MEESSQDLSAKVAFLLRPDSYLPQPSTVASVETHMAWVFLAGEFAYKLKKPVRYDFLDYGTVEARRWSCEEELRLNRRLAPTVYLGVVPLTLGQDGGLVLGDRGRVVDWLVHMRRLPAELSLDRVIAAGPVPDRCIAAAALKMAGFYRDAAPVLLSPDRYRDRFQAEIVENLRELGDPSFDMPKSLLQELAGAQEGFLQDRAAILDRRVADGRIVEAHGDLRPEHIYLEADPSIIDCLEFDRELRFLDPADELSFLTVECDRLGQASVGRRFLQTYARVAEDDPPAELLRFYGSFRAFLRARIAIRHLRDGDVRDPSRWPARALEYLRFARKYLPDQ